MIEYRINPQIENVSIQVLIDRINKGYKLQEIDRDLNDNDILYYNGAIILAPDYQREYRFTIEDEVKLVESVLVGIPIPPIFLATDQYKKVRVTNVVDGQHRLRALYRFYNNDFKLSGLTLLDGMDGCDFNDLDITTKSEFVEVKLLTTVFRDFPGIKFELEIFNRYNKGTKPLSPQEIRHAVYNSQLNSYINDFTYGLYKKKSPHQLYLAYNVTKDRIQKKKVQEGLFVILSILENGINTKYDKSLVYAEEYMKEKSELEKNNPDLAKEKFNIIEDKFNKFNDFIIRIQEKVEYPFSKEIYGVTSRNYKFQISTAMILAAVFNNVINNRAYSEIMESELGRDKFLNLIRNELTNSFLEDPNYNASSTNSNEIKKLVETMKIEEI